MTKTMYDGVDGTQYTTLTANISVSDTTINVIDDTVFPDAPNILVLYSVDSNGNVDTWERCKYTAKVSNSLTISRISDEHASSLSDSPLNFNSGDRVARMWTNWDYEAMKEFVEDLTSSSLLTNDAWEDQGDLVIGSSLYHAEILNAPSEDDMLLHKGSLGQLEWNYIDIDGGSP